MQRWCLAAFWRTLGPLAQATQDKAHLPIRTASPRLSCASHPTILILQETSDQTLGSPQKPIGDQGWSHRGPRSAGLLSPTSPSPSQTKAAASKPWFSRYKRGADSVLTGTPCLFIHWRGCFRPLILFSK